MQPPKQRKDWLNISMYVTGASIVVIYGYVLFRTYRGSKLKYLKQIGWLSVVGGVGMEMLTSKLARKLIRKAPRFYIYWHASGLLMLSLGLGLGRWIFSFKYYKIQTAVKNYRKSGTVPVEATRRVGRINKVMIYAICFVAIVPALFDVLFFHKSFNSSALLIVDAVS